MQILPRLYLLANAMNAWGLLLVLAAAFGEQLLTGEPPCPLCVMQRIAMMLATLGPAYVLMAAERQALTARHVAVGAGISTVASLLGAAISVRQILLHILPGDPGFGAPVFGYHLYTWAAVAFACNLLAAGLQLVGLEWFETAPVRLPTLARLTVLAIGFMLMANIVSVVAEAGFTWKLPDNPTGYLLFGNGKSET